MRDKTRNIIRRNNVKVTGKGDQIMIFAHGFGCDQNMWRFVSREFEKDYRIILFDYVGAGKSDLDAYNPERYSSLYGYAEDVVEILEELHTENVIFVGHSVSCMIGLIASIQHPHLFSRLIMVGPSPYYLKEEVYNGGFTRTDIESLLTTMDQNFIGWANFLAPQIVGNPDRPELGQELTDSFCSTDPVIARKFAEVTFLSDNRHDVKNAPVPSLIMQCSEDIIAPLSVGEYLAREMPSSTLVVLKATGHCPQLSAPEETVANIKKYLAKQPA